MAEIRKMSAANSIGSGEEVTVRIVNQMVFVRNESPIQDPANGPENFLTNYEYVPNTLIVTLNGLRQKEGADYDYVELGDNSFKFNVPIVDEDAVICDYIKIMS